MKSKLYLPLMLAAFLAATPAARGYAQSNAECLACHGDAGMQDAQGKSIAVDGSKFHDSVHGPLECKNCHADIKSYPHPDKVAKVNCSACHADEAANLASSVHSEAKDHPCTSCHGSAHTIFPKNDPRSAVYALNVPKTCGACHGNGGMGQKHGLNSVLPSYLDSIHGFALSKEGLLVAANCDSCHGSHHILSHKDPLSPTNRVNVPATCGKCHAGITAEYMGGVHGKAVAAGDLSTLRSAPTAIPRTTSRCPRLGLPYAIHAYLRLLPHGKFSTYRDTFHSQLGALGGYVETARCWDCHGAHGILPTADPNSPVNPANLVATCGRCHAGANADFVKYQPHANARNRKLNPALYYVTLFMNILLAGVLTFFLIHTILWLIRARIEQVKKKGPKEAKMPDQVQAAVESKPEALLQAVYTCAAVHARRVVYHLSGTGGHGAAHAL